MVVIAGNNDYADAHNRKPEAGFNLPVRADLFIEEGAIVASLLSSPNGTRDPPNRYVLRCARLP